MIGLRLRPGILKSDRNGRCLRCPSFRRQSACCPFGRTAAARPQQRPDLLCHPSSRALFPARSGAAGLLPRQGNGAQQGDSAPETHCMNFTRRLKSLPAPKRLIRSSLLVCSSFLKWNQSKFWPLSSSISQRGQSALPPSGPESPAVGVWRVEGSDSPLTIDTRPLLL